MKVLKQLKLNQLSEAELEQKELGQLLGGKSCGCGCNGPSSTTDNANANWYHGYSQSQGGNKQCATWGDVSWDAKF